MDKKATGQRIKQLRDGKAWTQEHLAAAADVSVRTVQRAEEGVMSAETLSAIAGAFDLPVEEVSRSDDGFPLVTPVVYCEDAATLDWLADAFGFEIQMKYVGPDGRIQHAEIGIPGGGKIMCGSPMGDYRTPKSLDGAITQTLYIKVQDVKAHCARAREAGAEIVTEPEDVHGHRRYLARDPEGHHWYFMQPLG